MLDVFAFCLNQGDIELKEAIIGALVDCYLENGFESILLVIKLFLREKIGCEPILETADFAWSLSRGLSNDNQKLAILSCLCNLLYHNQIACKAFSSSAELLASFTKSITNDVLGFYACRCLFFSCLNIEMPIVKDLDLLTHLSNHMVQFSDNRKDECIKTLTVVLAKIDVTEIPNASSLVSVFVDALKGTKDPATFSHLVQGLYLFPVSSLEASVSKNNFSVVDIILEQSCDMLTKLSQESLAVHFLFLTNLIDYFPILRKSLRRRIFPSSRSESALKTQILDGILSCHHTSCKAAIEDFAFKLLKQSPEKTIYHMGLGHAAGILYRYQLLGGEAMESSLPNNSHDSSSDDEAMRRSNFHDLSNPNNLSTNISIPRMVSGKD